MLFTPKQAAVSLPSIRILRNYKKLTSLKPWLFKSKEMYNLGFSTPDQFNLQCTAVYSKIASKLIELTAVDGKLSTSQAESLKQMLSSINLSQGVKGSNAKNLLVTTILKYAQNSTISTSDLFSIYSNIVHPQLKAITFFLPAISGY